jgi:hypothetical protein
MSRVIVFLLFCLAGIVLFGMMANAETIPHGSTPGEVHTINVNGFRLSLAADETALVSIGDVSFDPSVSADISRHVLGYNIGAPWVFKGYNDFLGISKTVNFETETVRGVPCTKLIINTGGTLQIMYWALGTDGTLYLLRQVDNDTPYDPVQPRIMQPATMVVGASWVDFDGSGEGAAKVVAVGVTSPSGITNTIKVEFVHEYYTFNVYSKIGVGTVEEFISKGSSGSPLPPPVYAVALNKNETPTSLFLSGTDISSDTDVTLSVAVGDFNNDGHPDVVAGNELQKNRIYLNNGTSAPFEGVSGADISPDVEATLCVAVGDFNEDGKLDVVTGNYDYVGAGRPNRLYLGNGDGAFREGVNITNDADKTISIAIGDVNRDGNLDVAAGNFNTPSRLYLGNGDGTFQAGQNISSDANSTYSLTLGDVDGDGDLDIVAGNSYGQIDRLYLNNGTDAPFDTGKNIGSDADWTIPAVLGDVDGDHDLDFVAGNFSGSLVNRLYRNNGTADPFSGVSGEIISSANDLFGTSAVLLGDIDGDGDLDLIATGYGSLFFSSAGAPYSDGQRNRLYLNDGHGNFDAGADITLDTGVTRGAALADMNGDGKPDLIAGRKGVTNRLYLNAAGSTSVEDHEVSLPGMFTLEDNFPNPFNPSTTLLFDLSRDAAVKLNIYDITGRHIATLADGGMMRAGSHSLVWSGKDRNGAPMASGIYFYRMEAGNQRLTKRMLLLK